MFQEKGQYTRGEILKILLHGLLDCIFPRFCVACQKEGSFLCEKCIQSIPIFSKQHCPNCFRISLRGFSCHSCQIRKKPLDGGWILSDYKNHVVNRSIHALKFSGIRQIPFFFQGYIFSFLENKKNDFFPDIIVPVPLHRFRLADRGFNQSEIIATVLTQIFQIPCDPKILKKRKITISQTKLERAERLKNVQGSFSVNKKINISGKNILLVDDVITTGSTVSECARVLKKRGAKSVWLFALAKS